MLAPPHTLHSLLRRLCSHICDPPHSLHSLLRRLWGQMPTPPHSLHLSLRRLWGQGGMFLVLLMPQGQIESFKWCNVLLFFLSRRDSCRFSWLKAPEPQLCAAPVPRSSLLSSSDVWILATLHSVQLPSSSNVRRNGFVRFLGKDLDEKSEHLLLGTDTAHHEQSLCGA
jgi:hypothetical protein